MQELLQVHEFPVRRQEARGEVDGRPGDAGRHVRGTAPARPAAALPAPPVGVRGPVVRHREEAGQNPLPDRARKRRRLAAERPAADGVRRSRCRRGARKRKRGGRRRAARATAPGGLVRRRLDRLPAGAGAGCCRADLRLPASYDLVVPGLPLRVVSRSPPAPVITSSSRIIPIYTYSTVDSKGIEDKGPKE